jgi:hypothetical protein
MPRFLSFCSVRILDPVSRIMTPSVTSSRKLVGESHACSRARCTLCFPGATGPFALLPAAPTPNGPLRGAPVRTARPPRGFLSEDRLLDARMEPIFYVASHGCSVNCSPPVSMRSGTALTRIMSPAFSVASLRLGLNTASPL